MSDNQENSANVVHLDITVNSILRHLIRACQGREHKEILHNELNWAQDMLNRLIEKLNDENVYINYSEADREKLIADYEHSKVEMYL